MGSAGRSHRRGRDADGSEDAEPVERDCREAGLEAPGTEEVAVVPWPLMMPRRVRARAEQSDRYPWLVLSAALVART